MKASLDKKNNINMSQKGFTLVELMVALTLGLLISAAAIITDCP